MLTSVYTELRWNNESFPLIHNNVCVHRPAHIETHTPMYVCDHLLYFYLTVCHRKYWFFVKLYYRVISFIVGAGILISTWKNFLVY